MYFWISLKDLASDLENLTFELTPGGTPRTGGTPKGGPRGKSIIYHQISLRLHQRCIIGYWILVKDLKSDLENLTFELTRGVTPCTGGTPGGP